MRLASDRPNSAGMHGDPDPWLQARLSWRKVAHRSADEAPSSCAKMPLLFDHPSPARLRMTSLSISSSDTGLDAP